MPRPAPCPCRPPGCPGPEREMQSPSVRPIWPDRTLPPPRQSRCQDNAIGSCNQTATLLRNGPTRRLRICSRPQPIGTDFAMRAIALVTDADLARARDEPEFRHRLLAENLDLLLRELNKLRSLRDRCRARTSNPRRRRSCSAARRPAAAHCRPATRHAPCGVIAGPDGYGPVATPCLSFETPYKPRFRSTPAGS